MRPAFLIFQFTPLREGRPGQAEEQLQRWMISIHAPPRGATHKVILRGQNIVFISIHAPPRGATPYARCIRASRDISIHAPPRGATDNKAIWDFTKGISIHAPPRGATGKRGNK